MRVRFNIIKRPPVPPPPLFLSAHIIYFLTHAVRLVRIATSHGLSASKAHGLLSKLTKLVRILKLTSRVRIVRYAGLLVVGTNAL